MSSCIQTFQDSLIHGSQTNVLRLINPNSLDQEQQTTTNTDYYLTSPTSKQEELQPMTRRFSYADLLNGQTSNSYENDPYYLPLTSSPSNDSDDYPNPHSSGSDSSTSPTNDQISFMDGGNSSNSTLGPFLVNDIHLHPASQSTTPHPADMTSPVSGISSASTSSNMHVIDTSSTSMQPFNLTCSPTPSVVEPHFLQQQQQQHRHSIATAQYLGNNTAPLSSSFYDSNIQRHHSFDHNTMFEQARNHPQQQQQYFSNNSNSGIIQGYSNLGQHPSRPMTPVSPHIKDNHRRSNDHMHQGQQGMINDLCASIPPSSMFNMSPLSNDSSIQSPSIMPSGTNHTHLSASHHHHHHHRASLPILNHNIKQEQIHDEKNNQNTKKTPRSRGRRVSNIPSNGARMFVCKSDGCGKVFKRSEHLKRHIRSIHTLEKPFECPYQSCNKRFSRSDNLNQHIRIHRHSNSGATKLDKHRQPPQQPTTSSASDSALVSSSTSPSSSSSDHHQSSENPHFSNYVQNFI
ncbi:unnamed protein product [Absidia cylindrospora]